MSDKKKLTREQIEQLRRDKIGGEISGKFQDKGLPLRNPSAKLVSQSNAGSGDAEKGK